MASTHEEDAFSSLALFTEVVCTCSGMFETTDNSGIAKGSNCPENETNTHHSGAMAKMSDARGIRLLIDSIHHSETTSAREDDASLFEKLPAEIRNMIYRLVLKEDGVLSFRELNPATICRVSRVIRKEALAIFFDVNIFKVVIRASYVARDGRRRYFVSHNNTAGFVRTEDDRFHRAGTLRLPLPVIAWLRSTGPETNAVRVRNLDVELHDIHGWNHIFSPGHAAVSMRYDKKTRERVVTSRVSRETVTRYYDDSVVADMQYIASAVTTFLNYQRERPHFDGLDYKDLMLLANTLRVEPRAGAKLKDLKRKNPQ